MAKKVNPKIFRIGITERSSSNWFAQKSDFAKFLHKDIKIRKVITDLAKASGIDRIYISRTSSNTVADVYVGRPGLMIGKGGSGIEMLEKEIQKQIGEKVKISVHEVKQPYLAAKLVAQSIADGMLRRIPPKVLMRQQMDKMEASGAQGARVEVSGIGPLKQARTERMELKGGKIPLTTLRAKIDYGFVDVLVPGDKLYGIKVWIYKGEI
jgi:small subunit ribosomal protein S3